MAVFEVSCGKRFSGSGRCDAGADIDSLASPSSSLISAASAVILSRRKRPGIATRLLPAPIPDRNEQHSDPRIAQEARMPALAIALLSSALSAPALPAGELTRSLGLLEELARRDGIRAFAIPVAVGECWGSLASCADVELVLSHTTGDLYDPPTAYALPMAKSWTFVGWVDEDTLVLRTTLPDAHIADEARAAWKAVEYTVTVTQDGASYLARTLD